MQTIKREELSRRQQGVIYREAQGPKGSYLDWYLRPDGTLTGLTKAHEAGHARNGKPLQAWKKVV